MAWFTNRGIKWNSAIESNTSASHTINWRPVIDLSSSGFHPDVTSSRRLLDALIVHERLAVPDLHAVQTSRQPGNIQTAAAHTLLVVAVAVVGPSAPFYAFPPSNSLQMEIFTLPSHPTLLTIVGVTEFA